MGPGTPNNPFINGCFNLDDEPKSLHKKWLEITISIHFKLIVFWGGFQGATQNGILINKNITILVHSFAPILPKTVAQLAAILEDEPLFRCFFFFGEFFCFREIDIFPQLWGILNIKTNKQTNKKQPGDSSRDLLIPDRWRSLNHLKGHLTIPKSSQRNSQECF